MESIANTFPLPPCFAYPLHLNLILILLLIPLLATGFR